jgi:hypothetical protein
MVMKNAHVYELYIFMIMEFFNDVKMPRLIISKMKTIDEKLKCYK